MKIKSLTPFPFGTKVTSRRPPRPEMAVIVRACYVLAPGKPLALPEGVGLLPQGFMTAETYRDDDEERAGECLYPGDFDDWKPRAEVMLKGTCHTPGGKPLSECPVRFGVGRWSKIVRVVGRRFWSDDLRGAVMSDAAPFTKMPLGYASAFGGPEYAQNPVGKGFSGRELPNVEHADLVIRSRRDDFGPAGFGPLSPAWPERRAKMGREYGARWLRERAPWFSEDFDWGYFNAAPADQQLDGYLRGDEALLFQNLHPDAPVLEAHLPGLRLRAFAKDVKQRFREVKMSLDTLFADLDEGKLYLTWRGLDPIETDDATDVEALLVASEKLDDEPLPERHYRGLLAAFEADPLGLKESLPAELLTTFDEMQQRVKDRAEGKAPVHAAPAPDPLTALVRTQLDLLPAPFSGAKDLEKQTAEAFTQMTAKAPSSAEAKVPSEVAKNLPTVDVKAQLTQAANDMARQLVDPPTPAIPLRPGGPPPAWAAKELAKALEEAAKIKGILAAQKVPDQAAGEVAKAVAALDEQLAELQNEPFFKSILNRPAPEEPGPGKALWGQDYEGRDLRGVDLRAADLRDANLARADLTGANLTGANLEGAVLVEANLTGADLTGANLTLVNFTGARAKGAILRGATLTRAFFQKADLTSAVLAEARGGYTFLAEATLVGIDGKGLTLDDAFASKAKLGGADLSGAVLTRCHFLEVDARRLDLTRASLTRTSFAGSNLREATVREARGDRTMWMKATLDDADFGRALLPKAFFHEASAPRASFRRATLKGARCDRASFEQADFTEANLFGIDFTKCALSGARFVGANLYEARFRQAAGRGCDFSGANLKRATLEEA